MSAIHTYVRRNKYCAAALWLASGLLIAAPAFAQTSALRDKQTIMFVCLHGSATSQMAAAHFNQIASERSLPYVAISRGIDAGSSIPTRIRDGLSLDGLTPLNEVPKPLTPDEAGTVIKVIAFDAVPDSKRGLAKVDYWSDVPPAIKDYAAARDLVVQHIDRLIPVLAERANPRETMQGVVAGIDQRGDRMTVLLADDNSDFKVQDGLIFDIVDAGDRVEITVERIGGAKIIVGLKKL